MTPLPAPQSVRHPAEVQAVTGTEERAGADDHSWQVIVGDHPLHGQVGPAWNSGGNRSGRRQRHARQGWKGENGCNRPAERPERK
jgi:hypothetical protein